LRRKNDGHVPVSTPILRRAEGVQVLAHSNHVLLDPGDETWKAFAASNPCANIFHHPSWAGLLAECYGYRPFVVVARDADGAIRAGLPMMEVNSLLTGRRWISLPFTDHCSPLYRDHESLRDLTNGIVALSRDANVPEIRVRWKLPANAAIQLYSHDVLHTIRLSSDVESVVRRIKRKHFGQIRAAQRRGVRIIRGGSEEHLNLFYRLHLHHRRQLGIPVQPKKFFVLLRRRVVEQGMGFLLLAYKDAECVAVGMFLHWRQTLTYKYSACSLRGRRLLANDPLLWTAIRWGCENGYTVFDMGKTDVANTGLRDFKGRWGAEETPLIYSTLAPTPPRPTTGKLARVMQAVIRNSPAWVCRAAGELLYRHFP